jgi:hypothetical protein
MRTRKTKQPTLKKILPKLGFTNSLARTRPIMGHVLVTNGKIKAYDLETLVEIKDSQGLLSGLHCKKNLKTNLNIGSDFKVEDYPDLIDLDDFEVSHYIGAFTLKTTDLEKFLPHASKDETRLWANSICIEGKNIVVTDGHTLKHDTIDNYFEGQFLMPRTSCEVLLKFLKLYKLESVKVDLNSDYAVIYTEHFNLSMRLIQRQFAKWSAVIPKGTTKEFKVNNWIDFKKVKHLFNGRFSCGIYSYVEGGDIWLKPKGSDVEFKIGENAPEKISIGFNASFIERCVQGEKSFTMKYNNELSPFIINDCVAMPLKL